MKKLVTKVLSLSLTFAMITTLCFALNISAAFDHTTQRMESPAVSIPNNSSTVFAINIAFNNVDYLRGLEFKLHFNTDVFSYVATTYPTAFDGNAMTAVKGASLQADGSVKVVAYGNYAYDPNNEETYWYWFAGPSQYYEMPTTLSVATVRLKLKTPYSADAVYPLTVTDIVANDANGEVTIGESQLGSITVGNPVSTKHATVTWPTISEITYGDAFSAAIGTNGSALDGATPVAGTFSFADGATVPDAGTYAGKTLTFTPNNATAYYTETKTVDVNVKKANKVAPAISVSSKTANSITIAAVEGALYGYKKEGSADTVSYSSNNVITGLTSNTSYVLYTKLAETTNYNESPEASISAKTDSTVNDDVNDDQNDLDYSKIGFNGKDERTGATVAQDKDNVVGKITLPSVGPRGSAYNWTSSNPKYLRNNGDVIRPSAAEGDQPVTMTANIGKGGASADKEFTIIVKALPAPPSAAFDKFNAASPVIQIKGPSDVAVDKDGNIIVADSVNNRILKYNSTGDLVATYGGTAAGTDLGQFNQPMGVAVGADNSIYVADSRNSRVQKFDGTTWTSYSKGFYQPMGLFVDGTKVYVADTYNHRIVVFDTVDSDYLVTFGSKGNNDNQFLYPKDVAVDSVGNIWVCDLYNNAIKRFTADGQFVIGYAAELPYGVAVDASGNVYATQRTKAKILCVNNTSEYAGKGTSANQFTNPTGITVDTVSNNMWVVDVTKGIIKKAVMH